MLYDHILTFPYEVALVWRARSSFGRNGFLLNKYLTLTCLLITAYREYPVLRTATFVRSVHGVLMITSDAVTSGINEGAHTDVVSRFLASFPLCLNMLKTDFMVSGRRETRQP